MEFESGIRLGGYEKPRKYYRLFGSGNRLLYKEAASLGGMFKIDHNILIVTRENGRGE